MSNFFLIFLFCRDFLRLLGFEMTFFAIFYYSPIKYTFLRLFNCIQLFLHDKKALTAAMPVRALDYADRKFNQPIFSFSCADT